MDAVTIILFLLPSWLLWSAWRRSSVSAAKEWRSDWRIACGKIGLVLAVCSTLFEIVFFFSYFHNGGSPHGFMPLPGIWRIVGRLSLWALVATLLLTALGKGKWRLFILGWAAAYALAVCLVFALEMD